MSILIDLSQLPAPKVIEELDYEVIFAEMLAELQALDPQFDALVESDPAYKILEVVAYREMIIRQKINDDAKAVMLAYATGSDLDNLGALFNVVRKTDEDDEAFRTRILLAPEGYTTAGSEGAYAFHSLSADDRVKDVDVSSAIPGEVDVTILSNEGDGTAPQDLLDAVDAALNAEEIRPLTDTVNVQGVTIVNYTIEATLTFYAGPDYETVRQEAEDAVTKYAEDHHKLGHDIAISGLHSALHQPGVQNVDLTEPLADIIVPSQSAAYATSITVIAGGVDE